jgi:hypothetical protein
LRWGILPGGLNQLLIKLLLMVTITNLEKRKNKKDEEFNVLILQGNVEVVLSKTTGRPYLTARKTSIPITFDEALAQKMIGQELPGAIERLETDEYEFTIPGTKNKVKLSHRWQYNQEPATVEEVVG